jgi:hypothetical protein
MPPANVEYVQCARDTNPGHVVPTLDLGNEPTDEAHPRVAVCVVTDETQTRGKLESMVMRHSPHNRLPVTGRIMPCSHVDEINEHLHEQSVRAL